MSSLSQAPRLGDLPSPHGAFQEHAAHVARWPATLSSKGSLGTCIPKVLRHSYIALSRRTDNGHYVNMHRHTTTPQALQWTRGIGQRPLHQPCAVLWLYQVRPALSLRCIWT